MTKDKAAGHARRAVGRAGRAGRRWGAGETGARARAGMRRRRARRAIGGCAC